MSGLSRECIAPPPRRLPGDCERLAHPEEPGALLCLGCRRTTHCSGRSPAVCAGPQHSRSNRERARKIIVCEGSSEPNPPLGNVSPVPSRHCPCFFSKVQGPQCRDGGGALESLSPACPTKHAAPARSVLGPSRPDFDLGGWPVCVRLGQTSKSCQHSCLYSKLKKGSCGAGGQAHLKV